MKILIFHPSLIPPKDYGGVERVVFWLAKGLVERGHEVWVGAYIGSQLPKGVKILEFSPGASSVKDLQKKIPRGLELVHFMAPPGDEKVDFPCPTVLTVHGNGQRGEIFPKNSIFLSQNHAQRHGSKVYVYNGVDPAEFEFNPNLKTKSYLFLSKTSWSVKNLKGCIELCLKAKAQLKIAGGNRPYFYRVKSLIRPGLSWIGKVSGPKKARLLAEAKALLFPVLWDEPFGLVVVEALLSGTPVLASPSGSLPELVPPDVGFLLDPVSQKQEWVKWLSQKNWPFSPERCRKWALEKFHYQVMAEKYEKIYQRVQGGDVLNKECPL